MSDSILCAEINRLRTELAANERVAARLEEQRAKAGEEARCLREKVQAQAKHIEKVSSACHKTKEQLWHVKRQLAIARAEIKRMNGTLPAYVAERYAPDQIRGHHRRLRKQEEEIEKLQEQRAKAEERVRELERLRAFDTSTIPLPKGLMLEYQRLDDLWQQLVREQIEAKTRVRGLEEQLADASRVCDTPGCLAAVVRRDDGSRVCAVGHNSRWVDGVELIRARGVNKELERQLIAIWNVRDAQTKEMAEAQADLRAYKETFRINEAYAAEKANKVDEQGLKLGDQALQIRELEASCVAMRTVLEQCFDYLTMLSFVDFWEKWGTGVKATTWGTADKFVATNITKALAIKEAPDASAD